MPSLQEIRDAVQAKLDAGVTQTEIGDQVSAGLRFPAVVVESLMIGRKPQTRRKEEWDAWYANYVTGRPTEVQETEIDKIEVSVEPSGDLAHALAGLMMLPDLEINISIKRAA